MKTKIDIFIGKSKIHGLGRFAAHDFKGGEVVIKWDTHQQLTKEKVDNLSEKEKNNVSYINGKYILVPPEGRINHSCNPNVYLHNFCYVAKKNIKKGEEITTDYRKESEYGFKMKCRCGSKNCRGIIKVEKIKNLVG